MPLDRNTGSEELVAADRRPDGNCNRHRRSDAATTFSVPFALAPSARIDATAAHRQRPPVPTQSRPRRARRRSPLPVVATSPLIYHKPPPAPRCRASRRPLQPNPSSSSPVRRSSHRRRPAERDQPHKRRRAFLGRLGNGCRGDAPQPPRARRSPRPRRQLPPGGGEGDAVHGGRGGRVARAAAGGQGEVLRRLGRQHHLLRRRLRRYSNHRRRRLTCI